jgi:hypothetical protein
MWTFISKLTPSWFSLETDRQWRWFLLVLFCLAFACRALFYVDLEAHPVGNMEAWQGTTPWFYAEKAQSVAFENTWLMTGPNVLLERHSAQGATPDQWIRLTGHRLPRGSVAVYLMALSFSLTQTLALYKLFALLAGSLIIPGMADLVARMTKDRRAGAMAGILAACAQPLVCLTLIPGPWIWEALIFLWILLGYWRVRDDQHRLSEWAMLGLAIGVGIWLRPLFFWGAVLFPVACLVWKIRPNWQSALAIALPVVLLTFGLVARNHVAGSTHYPLVGQQGWDFYLSSNAGSVVREASPSDLSIMIEGNGRFTKVFRIAIKDEDFRQHWPGVIARKIRELFGARDVSGTFDMDYIRHRSEFLRLTTVTPDLLMAAGLASIIFLLCLGRFPKALFPVLIILTIHGLLFRTIGPDRVLLHLLNCIFIAMAFTVAVDQLKKAPWLSFLFLALWAGMHLMLQIDDQARGPRFRSFEYNRSAFLFRYQGKFQKAKAEMKALEDQQALDLVFGSFWYRRNS